MHCALSGLLACPPRKAGGVWPCSLVHRDNGGFELKSGFEPQLYHLLALWPWTNYSSSLTFITYNVRMIKPTSQGAEVNSGSHGVLELPPFLSPGLTIAREGSGRVLSLV